MEVELKTVRCGILWDRPMPSNGHLKTDDDNNDLDL